MRGGGVRDERETGDQLVQKKFEVLRVRFKRLSVSLNLFLEHVSIQSHV